ncbi:MAG TPA: hypothetical protein VJ553_01930 [Candidatus Paceibacterota bacterium]|nr:hypothetical protein [Candidatus Paceibacterota bacterium]
MFDTDTPTPFRAPVGMWRVVEVGWDGGEEALAVVDAIHTDPDDPTIPYRRRGPLHTIIGDYDSFYEASTVVDEARPPWRRLAFNDEGVQMCGFRPGNGGLPEAGAES